VLEVGLQWACPSVVFAPLRSWLQQRSVGQGIGKVFVRC